MVLSSSLLLHAWTSFQIAVVVFVVVFAVVVFAVVVFVVFYLTSLPEKSEYSHYLFVA